MKELKETEKLLREREKKSLYKCGDREPKKRICFKKTMNSQ